MTEPRLHREDQQLRVTVLLSGRFHAFDLARELERRGLLHRLVTTHPKFQTRSYLQDQRSVVTLLPFFVAGKMATKAPPRISTMLQSELNQQFSRIAARYLDGANLVHAFSGVALHSLQRARRQGIRTVLERSSSHILTQMSLLEEEYASLGLPFERPAQRWMQRDLEEYELADAIAVPSSFVRRSFLAHGIPESRLIFAPFGADLRAFAPAADASPPRRFRVIFAGQVGVRKGIHHLVDGFNAAAIRDSELVLVGGTSAETSRVMRAADANVRMIGHVPQSQLCDHYRAASVFVMASIEEGLAVVQAQALASGLALICTTSTGGEDLLALSGAPIREHEGGIVEFPAGYVVPARSGAAIARCLRWLAEDADLLVAKREAAQRLRNERLGWDRYADRVVAGYRRVVSERP